ncbi:prephenate dehydrogenase [Actinokineospora sp. UTMC 2448]|uniref:prephenate dehydrogenase n=1 Tax=Actinokineospora sp. UTMC 2448 TaxID=2268449 RepID=UPI0021648CCC|nr:prephenate dehydrogenase [Actinokineospora sp. UTMC 2448]UVS76524.1 Arogenate dehydrogenase [Actinokineospora sp. UTMC 2448]
MRAVCVIGLGLIGGSLLRAVAATGRRAWGATASEADAADAAAAGFEVSDVDTALRRAGEENALIVLAVPLPAVESVARRVAELAPHCPLTDVTSVKAPVADLLSRRAPNPFVGGHPMAGSSESGWSAGAADLFHGAAWVVTVDDGTDPSVWREVAGLALSCGAHVVPATAAAHDDAVGRISHLPHILAAVLAACGADGGPLALALAAGSFTDGTRVAGTRPELVVAMCEGNRAALLDAVDDALGRLGAARGALASTGGLRATITAGHSGRTALEAHRAQPTSPVTIDLDAPDALADLRDLGAAGGRVIRLDGHHAVGELPDGE